MELGNNGRLRHMPRFAIIEVCWRVEIEAKRRECGEAGELNHRFGTR